MALRVVLAAPLAVDVGSGPLPIGTTVASHYVFFDPGPTQHMIGTVTFDVARAVREVKGGKVEFRTDKTALVHVPVGKLSFDPQKLVDNAMTVITSVVKAKPSAAKGKYIKGVTLSSTMGPGVPVDPGAAEAMGRRARERVLDEHTYAHRARQILELVGLQSPVTAGG